MPLKGFPPLSNKRSKILIIGSMPGLKSLKENQYYAHPQNLFWSFMHEIFKIDSSQNYQDKCNGLLSKNIALWDAAKSCERKGSLDSAIVSTTVVPNDFRSLFKDCPKIQTIAFNGQKAENLFKKLVINKNELPEEKIFNYISLPSTSPANASITKENKFNAWKRLKDYLK